MSQAYLSLYTGNIGLIHRLSIQDHIGAEGDSGTAINVVQLGQLVRLYANPGSSIQFGMGTTAVTDFSGYPNCFVALSGQAISVP